MSKALVLVVGMAVGGLSSYVYLENFKSRDHYAEGMVLMQKSKFTEAQKAFEQALRANPENPAVKVAIASAMQSQGKEEDALRAYQAADQESSKMFSQFYSALAALYQQKNDTQSAQGAFQKLAAFQPQSVDSYYNQGLAAASAGKNEEALRQFDHVLRIEPKHAAAAFQAGKTSEKMGEKRRAVTYYQIALRADAGLNAAKDRLTALQGGKTPSAPKAKVANTASKASRSPASVKRSR